MNFIVGIYDPRTGARLPIIGNNYVSVGDSLELYSFIVEGQ
jgi:hypothetical protein